MIDYSKTDYYFVDHKTFEESIENGEFIEFTKFSNNYYGTRYSTKYIGFLPKIPLFENIFSKKSIKDVQSSGKICILDIEIEGVKSLKKTDLNPRFVFVKPPNLEILVNNYN
jgi:guanylate kinase